MSEPRILIPDVETFPNLQMSWGCWPIYSPLNPDWIVRERSIICACWKWLGDKKIHEASVLDSPRRDIFNDRHICEALADAINSSDAIVTQNGDRFDLPWARTRMVKHGMRPFKPVPTWDTKKMAKSYFYFNSNRLDYMGKFLLGEGKIKTEAELWLACMRGDRKAIRQMITYCKGDVGLLERVFVKLRPYAPNKFNQAIQDFTGRTCPACGKEELRQWGTSRSAVTMYQRYLCGACGAWAKKPIGKGIVR